MTVTEPNGPIVADLDGALGAAVPAQRPDTVPDGGSPTDPSAAATTALLDRPDAADLIAGRAPVDDTVPVEDETAAAAPFPTRRQSGRYRSRPDGFQLELRVDVDGRRPLRKLSGDYFSVSGAAVTYFGSWTVDAVTVTQTPAGTVVVGTARTTWTTTFVVATVTIPRRTIFQPAAPATVRWSTPSGAAGATYVCAWESSGFRTVELEQDREASVTQFVSYDTGSLPSGGPARTLSVAGGYGEAGIQMLDTGGGNVLNTAANHVWNNASLHNAMVANFTRWADRPQFKVWLLHAMRHEFTNATSTLFGIMFDQSGRQRQGCATFYERMASGSAEHRRNQLYTNVHELGHCFNLYHSFHKSVMTPPLPDRPGSLSWMNYSSRYNPGGGAPSGPAAYWAGFAFQFDDLELTHLRHGFRDAVIMGGNPFGQGAALEGDHEYRDGVAGAELRISTSPSAPVLGTPIVLQIALSADRGRSVHRREQLHPKYGFVEVAVKRPNGEVVAHRPPAQLCATPDVVAAEAGEQLPTSAYIGYDAVAGQLFEDVGTYRVRASYTMPDGTPVRSNVLTVRVAPPRDAADDDVAELLLGDETGMVLTLMGTDSEHLADGTTALQEVLDRHGEHPNAVYARLALGMNAARPFLRVAPDGTTSTRSPDLTRADQLLTPAIEESRGSGGLDDLTVYQVMGYLARSHDEQNDRKGARDLRRSALDMARAKSAPAAVVADLQG